MTLSPARKIVLAGLAIVVPLVYFVMQAQGYPPVRDAAGMVMQQCSVTRQS